MTTTIRILLVEDDADLGNVLTHYLKMNQFDVDLCRTGDEALERIFSQSYNLYILDVMLPGMDGFTLAEHIRSKQDAKPFLFLTARNMKTDVLKGLKMGADDYITKPFEPEELLLRIRNILNRTGNQAPDAYTIGDYEFDYSRYKLIYKNQERNLTEREADLLKLLVEHKNTVVKRSDILQAIWGADDFFLGRSMDVFITRLRKYLEADKCIVIQSVRGVGIMLEIKTKIKSKY